MQKNLLYEGLKDEMAKGWNTWNTRSVTSHVLLPQGLALNLAFKEYKNGRYLREVLIGRQGPEDESVHPGPKSYDGSYSELTLSWRDIELFIQSGTQNGEWVLLVTPSANQKKPCTLLLEAGFLWNRPGYVLPTGNGLTAYSEGKSLSIHTTGTAVGEDQVPTLGAFLAVSSQEPVGFSSGIPRSVEEISEILKKRKNELCASKYANPDLQEVHTSVQTCLAWDTIYDPSRNRVISPVSRIWSTDSGGWILFCWDTYFAALMASYDNKELAYANAIEITLEMGDGEFVPNMVAGNGLRTKDRSQPCVGSYVVLEIFKRYQDLWFLELLFDKLLKWNRWWIENRAIDGLLAWGSDPYLPELGNPWESDGVGARFGASLESGLDNSPMYDNIPFDAERGLLLLQDVGLNGLYIFDCECLAEIARILGRTMEAGELITRAEGLKKAAQILWNEKEGIFLNRRTDTGESSPSLSPTLFYSLLGGIATKDQALRMVAEHFYNPKEFWGEWIMPSISRNDPAYPEQDYWRGRIWAPMNFLVYLGLHRYGLSMAQTDLAEKSGQLLLREWRSQGHVHENYGGDSGLGCDKGNSDRFYHWGGLLGTIVLMEADRHNKLK